MADPLPTNATAQIQRALMRNEDSFNGSTVYELLDLFRSWLPQDVPEFRVGQRVRVGEHLGTVHHCPPRVRVQLDGVPCVGEFRADFVHPAPVEAVIFCGDARRVGNSEMECILPDGHDGAHVGNLPQRFGDITQGFWANEETPGA